MLALETGDDWAFSVDVTVGANTETFTNAATDADAYAAIVALVAWCNDAGRAWTGTRTWTWSWARSSVGGAILTLSCSGTFDMSGGAFNVLLFPGDVGVTSMVADDVAVGTWAPLSGLNVTRWLPVPEGDEDGGGDGACRSWLPALESEHPVCNAVGTPEDAAYLTAALASASSPRRGWIYQSHTSTWLRVAVGEASTSRRGLLRYGFTLDLYGGEV